MPRLKEELQFPDRGNAQTVAPLTGISLINEHGVLKILHADGTKETVKVSDDLDQTFQYSNYYTREQVDQLLASAGAGVLTVILEPGQTLPSAQDAEENKIYLLPVANGYKEYVFTGTAWEEVGNDDLSAYLTTAEFNRQMQDGLAIIRNWED